MPVKLPKVLGLTSDVLNLGHFIDTLRYFATPSLNLVLVNNLLLDHVELPYVLDFAVHQVNFLG